MNGDPELKTVWAHGEEDGPIRHSSDSIFKQQNTQKEKPLPWYGIVLWIVIPLVLFFGISMLYFSSTAKPDDGCRRVTKQQQVITKLDGNVNSVNNEEITGVQCPDGSFYPDP